MDAYPVYSMATPTINGAKEVLAYLGANGTEDRTHTKKVIITDLREEVVVYIHGTPYVLRELDQPVDTLKHVGISGLMVSTLLAYGKKAAFSLANSFACLRRWNTWN